MPAKAVAVAHYRDRRSAVRRIIGLVTDLWRLVDPGDLDRSWLTLQPQLFLGLSGAQLVAARAAEAYLDAVLAEQNLPAVAEGRLVPNALAGIASDGRALVGLLQHPIIAVKMAIAATGDVDRSMAAGYANLDMIARTQVADAGRIADQVAMVARRSATGYVRMLVGDSCGRCVSLAGKRYAYNQGFYRHPRCDCVHVPGREDTTDEIRTDPQAYFRSLSHAEQDRQFTAAGAAAIREGADISQVVNARRGALGLSTAGARVTAAEAAMLRGGRQVGRLQPVDVFGRPEFVTTEGVTTRGLAGVRLGARIDRVKIPGARYTSARPPRLMPESILRIAGSDRTEAIRLLTRFGYIR